MLVDRRHRHLKELGELRLGQPHRAVLEAACDARRAIVGGIEDERGGSDPLRIVGHFDNPPIIARIRSVTPFNSASISASGRGGLNT